MVPLRTDFENLRDGARVVLYPNDDNPLHDNPVRATHSGGYFYCDNTTPSMGPDYYWRDVLQYNNGFTLVEGETP